MYMYLCVGYYCDCKYLYFNNLKSIMQPTNMMKGYSSSAVLQVWLVDDNIKWLK